MTFITAIVYIVTATRIFTTKVTKSRQYWFKHISLGEKKPFIPYTGMRICCDRFRKVLVAKRIIYWTVSTINNIITLWSTRISNSLIVSVFVGDSDDVRLVPRLELRDIGVMKYSALARVRSLSLITLHAVHNPAPAGRRLRLFFCALLRAFGRR